MPHQPSSGGCGEQRSRAETGHRNPGDEPTPVGKPLHQDRNRNDVTHAQPDSPDDSVGEIQPPKSVGRKTGEKNTSAPKQARHHRDNSRANAFHPQSAYNRAASKKKPTDQERPSDLRNAPPEFPGERDAKDAPCVRRPQSH